MIGQPDLVVESAALARLQQIKHIVVLMMENRSFDEMLGYLKRGTGRRRGPGRNGDEPGRARRAGAGVRVRRRFVAAPSHAFSANRENDFMHMKTMIIDDKAVVTGSYNFSENDEANDENLLVIEARDVAAAYGAYFEALYTTYGGKK